MIEDRQSRTSGSRARATRTAVPRASGKAASAAAKVAKTTKARPTGTVRPSSVDDYARGLGGWRADVITRLRAIMASAAPEARELIRGGHPRYDDHGPLCFIRAYDDRVEMGFWRGAEMPDPRGLLTDGAKTRMRRLVVVGPELVRRRERALKSLVRSAVRLNHLFGDPTKED